MKKRFSILILSVLTLMCSCQERTTETLNKSPGFYELGIPSVELYTDFYVNARNPWDMIIEDGKLYIGGGDYDLNSGPADICGYDIKTEKWSNSGTVQDEQVGRFIRIGDKIIAPGIDPRYDPENGRCYILNNSKWETFCEVPDAVHTFDIIEFDIDTDDIAYNYHAIVDDELYFKEMYSGYTGTVIKSNDPSYQINVE